MSNLITGQFPHVRMRRLRQSAAHRALLAQNRLSIQDLIYPIFVCNGHNIKQAISTLPGCYQWSLDRLPEILDQVKAQAISAIMLFGLPTDKDASGSSAVADDGIVQQALAVIKKHVPELIAMVDLCFCEYTDHGHCGVLTADGHVDNDPTLKILAEQAVSLARAGADVLAPSGMMDGKVQGIRTALDSAGFQQTMILSHSIKYASAAYGAFREAVDCSLSHGNRKSYQADPANGDEALKEVALDIQEGADLVMVKPAGGYQDIIYRVSQAFPGTPVLCYQVGTEYAMLKAAAKAGLADEKNLVLEQLMGLKRAGARAIVSYYALECATWINPT